MIILVTGCAGFIGAAVSLQLLNQGHQVIGIDNLNDYYDPELKILRLKQFRDHPQFTFHKLDIKDTAAVFQLFDDIKPTHVIHLAAQAGVRYSIENPFVYVESNLVGFVNILEGCRKYPVEKLIFASSSSVYGSNEKVPYSIADKVDQPISLYSATKKSNELMAHAYSHLYQIPIMGLRYFTVYGPWGRPDMAPMKFIRKILNNEAIEVFNFGHHSRDFTYIDDVVMATVKLMHHQLETTPESTPYKIYNIGYGQPVELLRFIELLEDNLQLKAIKEFLPKQSGDVEKTWADVTELERDIGYKPQIALDEGIKHFVEWYQGFYEVAV
jgi:UDP-glucuronate 4-epimerase